MAVMSPDRRVTYTGNGVTTVWDYGFQIYLPAHVQVSLMVIATEVVTPIDENDYLVTGIGYEEGGGTVTYPLSGPPLANTHKIIIERIVPYTQEQRISNQAGYTPETVERALDVLCMQMQQINDNLLIPEGSIVTEKLGPKSVTNVKLDDDAVDNRVLATGAAVANIGFTPAPINSPALTGLPTAPTKPAGSNDTGLATTAYVRQELLNTTIANSAPYLSSFATGTTVATVDVMQLPAPDNRWLIARGSSVVNAAIQINILNLALGTETPYKTITTKNGTTLLGSVQDVQFHTTLNGKILLLVGDYRNENNTQYESDSPVYIFDPAARSGIGDFVWLQGIATRGCRRVTGQRIGTVDWFCFGSEVSDVFNDGGTPGIANATRQRMQVYTWDAVANLLAEYQIKTNLNGTRKGVIVQKGANTYLIPSAYYDNAGTGASLPGNLCKMKMFKFQDSINKFVDWREIEVEGVVFVHTFSFAGKEYIFLGTEIAGEYFDRRSKIFEITATDELRFVCYVETRGCTGADSTTVNGVLLLGVVNAVSGNNLETTFDSSALDVWRFDGLSVRKTALGFEAFGLYDIKFFQAENTLWCATAETYSNNLATSTLKNRVVNLGKFDVIRSIPATPKSHQPGVQPAQGVLERLNATNLVFRRFGGDQIWVHGRYQQIPRAGIVIPNTGLSPNTHYAVFIYDGPNGEPVGVINTRVPFEQRSTGIMVDDEFAYRTYVGEVYTNASTEFVDDLQNRHVASYYNPRKKVLRSVFGTISGFNSPAFTALDVTKNLSLVTCGISSVDVSFSVSALGSVAGLDLPFAVFGNGAVMDIRALVDAQVANYYTLAANSSSFSLARGRHMLELRSGVPSGTMGILGTYSTLNAAVWQ